MKLSAVQWLWMGAVMLLAASRLLDVANVVEVPPIYMLLGSTLLLISGWLVMPSMKEIGRRSGGDPDRRFPHREIRNGSKADILKSVALFNLASFAADSRTSRYRELHELRHRRAWKRSHSAGAILTSRRVSRPSLSWWRTSPCWWSQAMASPSPAPSVTSWRRASFLR